MAGRHAQDGPPDGGDFEDDATRAMPQTPGGFDDDRTQAMPAASHGPTPPAEPADDRTRAMPTAPHQHVEDDRTRAMPTADAPWQPPTAAYGAGDTRRWPADDDFTDDRTRVFATQPGLHDPSAAADDAPTTVIPGPIAPASAPADAGGGAPPAPPTDEGEDGGGTRRRRWIAWVAIIVIVLLVVALVIALFALNGNDEDPAPTTTPTETAAQTSDAEPAPPAPPAPEPSEPEQEAAPEITAFEVSPTTVDCTAGGSVPLVFTWSSIDATEGWIGVGTNDAQAAPFDQISPGGGSYSGISFQCGTEQQTYALTVSGPGGTVSQTVTVTATSDDPADAGADADGGDTGGEGDDSGTPPPGP